MSEPITLSFAQIRELAEFSGLRVEAITAEEGEYEITIADCPAKGVQDDEGSIIPCRYIAYSTDYPEEGCYPLGSP